MVWCTTCDCDVDVNDDDGICCCMQCGRVLDEDHFASDLQFTKGADGEGQMVGHIVGENGNPRSMARYTGGRMLWSQGDSHEASVQRGRAEISSLVDALHVQPGPDAVEVAHRLYKLALQRGFTRGRRLNQVAAACLYIFCRQDQKPYMLIDFSDHLCINIYTLGAVYLQLLRLFRLDECPAFTKPVDPSLYVHRFAHKLKLGSKENAVISTSLKLVQSMKRDWMQTGRRPAGICGAALFIAANIHGCMCTKQDIISVVHVGWHTVEKRVVEFAHSEAADMTIADFEEKAAKFAEERERVLLEYEKRFAAGQLQAATPPPLLTSGSQQGEGEAGEEGGQIVDAEQARIARLKEKERHGSCEHVECGAKAFAYGMCRSCFVDYLVLSGGVEEGADPPAYTRGILTEIRKQVLALPLPPLPSTGLLQLADASEQLMLLEPRQPEDPSTAGQEEEEDLDVDALDAILSRDDLRHATRALAGPKAAALTKTRRAKAAANTGKRSAVAAAGDGGGAGQSASAAGPPGAAAAGTSTGVTESQEEEASGLRRSKRLKAGATPSVSLTSSKAKKGGKGGSDEEEQEYDTPVKGDVKAGAVAALKRLASATEDGAQRSQLQSEHGEGEGEGGQTQQGGGATSAGITPAVSTLQPAAAAATEQQQEGSQAVQPTQDHPAQQAGEQHDSQQSQGGPSAQGSDQAAVGDAEAGAIVLVPDREGGEEDGDAGALVVAGQDDEERVDRLSDVDDDDVDVYIASAEEAEVKGILWEELNKEWLEKQAQKAAQKAAAEAAGIVTKPKRAPRKSKDPLPPAENAELAVKTLVQTKKLSNKVNYKALEDLFKDPAEGGEREDSPGDGETAPGSPTPSQADADAAGQAAGSTAATLEELPVTTVTAAIKKRAAARAAEKTQESSRYQLALQQEQNKRGGGGGGLGGIFLGSLTFAGGSKGASGEGGPHSSAGLWGWAA